MSTKTLADLLTEHAAAVEALEAAQQQTSIARTAETDACNRLNDTQKAIDALIEEQRQKAPYNSDWGRKRSRGVAIP